MTTAFSPTYFDAPLVNPAPNGLFAATAWTDEDGPLRWLDSGVEIRPFNYGGEGSFGVWTADWCALEADLDPDDDVKAPGDRPAPLDPFLAFTSWAADECDLTERSREETRTRAAQTQRLLEQNAVESEVAMRLLTDAGTPTAGDDVVDAVSILEEALAETNTVGVIHASARVAASAAKNNLIVRSGAVLKTPLGHTWVFGGGYVDALGWTLVASSQPFGWREPVAVRDAMKLEWNRFRAVAERSLVIGYEAAVAAATID
jgi:hypothetical protein